MATLQTGNTASVIAEIEACIPALRRYASALLHNRQDVDDLVQDCLIRALDRLHSRRPDASLRAWLFSIMHNQFLSGVRHAKVRGRSEPIEVLDQVGEDFRASQESPVPGHDLLRALQSLPEEQRTALLLVTLEDLSYADVAHITGVPVGTVMSRLSRARDRLRRTIDDAPRPRLRRVK